MLALLTSTLVLTAGVAPAAANHQNLTALALSCGELDPPFAPASLPGVADIGEFGNVSMYPAEADRTTTYGAVVPVEATRLTVTAAGGDERFFHVNGDDAGDGSDIALDVGENTIVVEVRTGVGMYQSFYVIEVTRGDVDPCDEAPAVSVHPQDASVSDGATATFTADATGTPVPSVLWQVSTDDGATFTDTVETDTTLRIDASLEMDGHRYRAVFTNDLGVATTNPGTLLVTPAPQPGPPPPPAPLPQIGGGLPTPPSGVGMVTIGGTRTVPVTVGANTSELTVQGGGFRFDIFATGADGTRAGAGHGTTFAPGQGGWLGFRVEGLRPFSEVRLWLFSEPRLLGTYTTDASGALELGRAQLPADVLACGHTIQVDGELPDGQTVAAAVGIGVLADPFPFEDVDPAGTHAAGIGCVAASGLAVGRTATTFDATAQISRAQAASVVAALLGLDDVADGGFVDVADSVHAGAIGALARAGLVLGVGDERFAPSGALTRGQAAQLVAAALDLTASTPAAFVDVDGSPFASAISELVDGGVMAGFGDGTFRPGQPISRAQFATLVARALPLLP